MHGGLQARERWLLLLNQLQAALQPLGDAERALSRCASPLKALAAAPWPSERSFRMQACGVVVSSALLRKATSRTT